MHIISLIIWASSGCMYALCYRSPTTYLLLFSTLESVTIAHPTQYHPAPLIGNQDFLVRIIVVTKATLFGLLCCRARWYRLGIAVHPSSQAVHGSYGYCWRWIVYCRLVFWMLTPNQSLPSAEQVLDMWSARTWHFRTIFRHVVWYLIFDGNRWNDVPSIKPSSCSCLWIVLGDNAGCQSSYCSSTPLTPRKLELWKEVPRLR